MSSINPDLAMDRAQKIKEWKQFFIFCFVAILIRSFLITPCRVPSGSMLPTLQVGDFPILLKTTYGWSRYSILGGGYIPYFSGKIGGKSLPNRGDVVVFTHPKKTHEDLIKRVVGLPGDSVQMIGGILHLNDRPISLELKQQRVSQYDGNKTVYGDIYKATLPTKGGTVSYEILKQTPFGDAVGDNTAKYYVPDQHFFVLGDNPDGSGDSRYQDQLGFVHQKYLLGQPLFTYLSIDHEGIYLTRPWTWFKLPFKIRFSRCLYQRIQPEFTPTPENPDAGDAGDAGKIMDSQTPRPLSAPQSEVMSGSTETESNQPENSSKSSS